MSASADEMLVIRVDACWSVKDLCVSTGGILLSVRGLKASRSRGRAMVMPELAYQNEQFYPHGLKSMSKGVLSLA